MTDCDDLKLCTTDTCDAGFCSHVNLSNGTLEPGYVDNAEDCVIRACDGDGNGAEVADDDDDPPEDADACAERVCDGTSIVDGDPINEGLPCGPDPLVCTDGVCVGCDDPTDCPTPPGACQVATCDIDGACGADIINNDPADPDLKDCRTPTCDGVSPDITFVTDAAQTPDDIACGVGMCNGMTPGFTPVGTGNACAVGNGVCDGDASGASCVECVDDQATATDSGCANPATQCDESGAPVCKRCIVDAAAVDLGCTAGTAQCNPAGNAGAGECVDCYNSGGQAIGCTDPATDQCEEAPGAGTCFDVCYNVDPGADPGCIDPALTNCNEAGQVCQECTADGDCTTNKNGDDCRNAGSTKCGCNSFNDCNNSLQGHLCNHTGSTECGCDALSDCSGIPGVTACSGAGGVCMCGASPCAP